jgi:nucleoside-diphosphate-sugar epimerase
VTGSSGVVGRAILAELAGHRLICLRHRRPVRLQAGDVIGGDVREPRFGLDRGAFRELAQHVDVVVHAAAVTNMAQPEEAFYATNVRGAENVLELATIAEAPIYHLSTAFVHPLAHVDGGRAPDGYQRSKQLAEATVAASGLPAVVLRPSIVVGDSRTGAIARFQGFHRVFGICLTGQVPVLPAKADARIDFVPQDLVARVLACLVERDVTEGSYWLTAGEHALPIARLVELAVLVARRATGVSVTPPRLVSPALFERSGSVFLRTLPAPARRTAERSLHLLRYMNLERPLPSSLPSLLPRIGLGGLPDLEAVYCRNVAYWLRETSFGRPRRRPEVGSPARAAG